MRKSPDKLTARGKQHAQRSIEKTLVEFGELRSRLWREVESGDAEAADRTALAIASLSGTMAITEIAVRGGLIEHLRKRRVFSPRPAPGTTVRIASSPGMPVAELADHISRD